MAVTELWGPTWLNIVWYGTSDYTITKAILLRSIRFAASAVDDQLAIMQNIPGEADSAKWPFFILASADGKAVAMFEPSVGFNPLKALYTIDYSKCTFDTPANVVIQFVYEA